MRASGARTLAGIAFVILLALVASIGCESESTDPTGGETHFLRLCEAEGGPCGDGLSCICGVCTTACSVNDPCGSYPGAQCVMPPPSCEVVERSCDVQCASNEDCWDLSQGHHCIDGWCRLTSGAPIDPAPPTGAGGTDPDPPAACEPSGVSGNDVVILGDSFFATNHEITAHLEALARDAGVLSSVQRYRDYSNPTMNGLAAGGILGQYEQARDDAPVRVVIMNGGGADVLIGSCDPVDSTCPALVEAAAALDEVLAEMDADGVEDILFASYPDPQDPEVIEEMDVLRPMLEDTCVSSDAPCLFVELQPAFAGNEAEFIAEDGLNATSAGAQAAARVIWDSMVESCIAQ